MILDSALILSGTLDSGVWTGQRICNAAAEEASTDYVDTLNKGDAIAPGARLLVISTVICAGTGTTLTINLETDDEITFTSATLLASSGAIAKANTAAKTVLWDVVIPPRNRRYLRLNFVGDSTFETTGSVIACIVLDSSIGLDRNR